MTSPYPICALKGYRDVATGEAQRNPWADTPLAPRPEGAKEFRCPFRADEWVVSGSTGCAKRSTRGYTPWPLPGPASQMQVLPIRKSVEWVMCRLLPIVLVITFTGNVAAAGVFTPIPYIPQDVVKPLIGKDQPAEEVADRDDPAKLAERITENTKTAGDRLKDEDTSETTRQTQEQILKDIDKLLKQQGQQPPPPMGGGSPPPMGGGKGGGQPPKGQGKSGGMPPMGGQQNQEPQRQTRREKREQEQGGTPQDKPMGMNPEPMPKAGKQPMGMGEEPMPMNAEPKNPSGNGGTGGKTKPALPFDDAVTKQVWGHLPERLRQEMNQYYKEQFMSKYGEMLKQYYGSLAEREKAPKKP